LRKKLLTCRLSVCPMRVYCDKMNEVSNASVVRRLSVRRLRRVYCDETTKVSNTSVVCRLSVRSRGVHLSRFSNYVTRDTGLNNAVVHELLRKMLND